MLGAHDLEPCRKTRGPGHPPTHTGQAEHGTRAGSAEGHGPPGSALHGNNVKCARQGEGARTPRDRERTHTHNRARSSHGKGNRTPERKDRVKLHTSRSGQVIPDNASCNTHREARQEGGKHGTGGGQEPAPAPSPLTRAHTNRALRPPTQ